MYKKIITLSLLALLFSVQVEAAKVNYLEVDNILNQTRERVLQMQENRERVSSFVTETRDIMSTQRERVREEALVLKEEVLENSKMVRARTMEMIEEHRAEISTEVRNRIGSVVEEKINHLARQINMINMNSSKSYMNNLDRLEDLINKTEEKVEALEETTGSDMASVYEVLILAREELSLARNKAVLQEGVVYEITADSLEGIGQSFAEAIKLIREAHQELRKEMRNRIHERIREAHLLMKGALE